MTRKTNKLLASLALTNHVSYANSLSGPSVLAFHYPYIIQSTHPLATTMAPITKYLCPCFKCNLKKEFAKRTIQNHFKHNQSHLGHLKASGADQSLVDFVQDCQYKIIQLLSNLKESQPSRQSGSPDPAGEYLIFFAFNLLADLLRSS